MNNDILTVYDDNQKKDYKLLFVINQEYQYIIYTDLDNDDLTKNLYAIKVKSLKDNSNTIPITNEEWLIIEKTYNKLINKNA